MFSKDKNYTGKDLSDRNFSGLDLSNADFTESNLENTDFSNSNLQGSIFKKANMKNTKLDGAYFDNNTLARLSLANNYKFAIDRIQDKISKKMNNVEIKDQDMSRISCESKGRNMYNPVNKEEKCTLINYKKERYYIHTYDPRLILKNLATFPDIAKHFDLKVRHNCCNCISISLYFTSDSDIENCIKYITSIRRTVINVNKNLPDWIVRLYLDSSVHKRLLDFPESRYKKYMKESLNFLLEAENVEIYTYCCPSILNGEIPISRTRIFRFLPLIEKDVNVKIIREADGIVTNLDCHNIKIFSQSDYLFYLPEVIESYSYVNPDIPFESGGYSPWLRIYTQCLAMDYFTEKHQTYDLLAGTFGLRLIVKEKYYNKCIKQVRNLIDKDDFTCSSKYAQRPDIILNIGFDEILLLHLFRDYVSCRLNNKGEVEKILSIIIASHNIVKYDISQYEIDDNIRLGKSLVPLVKIDLVKPLAFLNDIMLSSFYDDELENQHMNIYPMLFIDAILKPDNIKPDYIFDIRYKYNYNKVRNLLSHINLPYGLISTNSKLYTKQLSYMDCLYDNI